MAAIWPLRATSAPNSFFFARLGAGPDFNGYDTLYVADSSGTPATPTLGITKYTFDGLNWNATGSIGTTNAYEGLTGVVNGGVVQLYATTPTGIFSISDNTGYGGTLAATINTVVTAGSNTQFRGVTFTPELPAVHFTATASPSTITAGGTFSVTVTARDSSNNVVTGYTGTVHFTSSDTNGSVVVASRLHLYGRRQRRRTRSTTSNW